MDDLLVSIRKVIAEDFEDLDRAEEPGAAPDEVPFAPPRYGRQLFPDRGPTRGLTHLAPSDETPDSVPRRAHAPHGLPRQRDGGTASGRRAPQKVSMTDAATAAAVSEIAAAIVENTKTAIAAAQLAAERRRDMPERREADQDITPMRESANPLPSAPSESAAAADRASPEAPVDEVLPENEPLAAAPDHGGLAALRARLDADAAQRRSARPRRSEEHRATEPKRPAEAERAALSNVVRLGREECQVPTPAAAHHAGPDAPADPQSVPNGNAGLISDAARNTVRRELESLSRTVLSDNPRTLEDLVRDMMQPLLKQWLEKNLPEIVERQVAREIDRVATRGR